MNFGGVAHGLGQEATLLLYSESFSGEPTDTRLHSSWGATRAKRSGSL